MMQSSLLAAVAGLAASVAALDPVEATGNKFFNKDGSQFFIKGVAYQLQPQDPLVDTQQCKLDANLMKDLGANTIRVYHVDADADHDGCMKALADAGIYLLVDLDTFGTYIEPVTLSWNDTQYDEYAKVMDTFHKYDNVLGFFVGNENIATKDASPAAPLLKAAARDMKAYRDSKGYRKIPVGYSAADIKELRPMLQDYLTCGDNSSEIVDFFGLNSYSWCDPSTYEESTYNQLQEYAKGFPVPIFFTETGCNVPGPRRWDDMDAIFSKPMVNDWSGAIVYEWIQEQNNYGIITYGSHGMPTPRSPDFDNLKSKWAGSHPSGVSKADYDAKAVSTRPCPTSTPGGWWQVDGNVKLPTLGDRHPGPSSTVDASASESQKKPVETATRMGDDNSGNAALADQRIAAIGAGLAATVLFVALIL
ncbi:glucanosyltransferase domain-containing protein [Hirsutella rhossiliensis]|uniref:1,3-beta-glucanosyltransferase n=1 Tax=Hirsutella rhossiliensis TaxID=111463 RepID=A0A9P8N6U2_9HYPO|nr:glucanosyltransferase domain-containing protein [Hirsutella rhossiliensis]KAH0966854.1 glucanosyltransferase domain-containing protein [Hirsutella rhossiliensis]